MQVKEGVSATIGVIGQALGRVMTIGILVASSTPSCLFIKALKQGDAIYYKFILAIEQLMLWSVVPP